MCDINGTFSRVVAIELLKSHLKGSNILQAACSGCLSVIPAGCSNGGCLQDIEDPWIFYRQVNNHGDDLQGAFPYIAV